MILFLWPISGTTSFKYKLFDMSNGEKVLAEGTADRIGQGGKRGSGENSATREAGT